MRTTLIQFLTAIERNFPPAPGAHHTLTYVLFGSDAVHVEHRLALNLHLETGVRQIFLEDGDLENPLGSIRSIAALLPVMVTASNELMA